MALKWHNMVIAMDKNRKNESTQYQPKTGQACSCRQGQERDNCSRCEGTGQVIDFAQIRARRTEAQVK